MGGQIRGGCKCGQVRYAGELAEAEMFRCYCRDCQQLTGTGHADMVPLVAESFDVTGERREFEMAGGSGKSTFGGFCPDCGSPLTRRSVRMADRIYVHAGSLEDPSVYAPVRFIYTDSAQEWDKPSDN